MRGEVEPLGEDREADGPGAQGDAADGFLFWVDG